MYQTSSYWVKGCVFRGFGEDNIHTSRVTSQCRWSGDYQKPGIVTAVDKIVLAGQPVSAKSHDHWKTFEDG